MKPVLNSGLILDSTLLLAAERGRFDWVAFHEANAETPVYLCAITLARLWQGYHRGATPSALRHRQQFLQQVEATIPVLEFGIAEARTLARLNGGRAPLGGEAALVAATALVGSHAVAAGKPEDYHSFEELRLANTAAFARAV
jgi:tRNA(fMet)-specific endonuclease VapC